MFHKKQPPFFWGSSSWFSFSWVLVTTPNGIGAWKTPLAAGKISGHLVSTVESRTFDTGHVLDIEARRARQVEDGGSWDIPMFLSSYIYMYIYKYKYIYIYGIGGSGIIWTYDISYIPNTAHRHIWWHMYIINYKTMCQKTVLKLMVGEHISHKHAVLFTCRFMWTEMTTRYYHTVLE